MHRYYHLLIALALFVLPHVAWGGFPRGAASATSSPLNLPLLSEAPTLTFLGSFPSPLTGAQGAMSVYDSDAACSGTGLTGASMYLTDTYEDPYNSRLTLTGGAIGKFCIPTLGGTPDYTGGNGSTSVLVSPTVNAAIVSPTVACGSTFGCTVSTTPATGDTSLTVTSSLPAGLAANDGWYANLQCTGCGSDGLSALITGLSGNTVSFAALANQTFTSTSIGFHQFLPPYQWTQNEAGYVITGTLPYNGELYVLGGSYYDANCNQQSGFILPVSLDLSTWGATASPATLTPSPQASRSFAGAASLTAPGWSGVLGAPALETSGLGALSILSCYVPMGFSLNAFDPSAVLGTGNSIEVTQVMNYPYTGAAVLPNQSNQLSYRSFSGPFPVGGGSDDTFAIAGGNGTGPNGLTGATAVTLAAPFPNNGLIGFYDTSSNAQSGTTTTTLIANAPSGGWPQAWAANYWTTAMGGGALIDVTQNAHCQVGSSTAVTQGSAGNITVTCASGDSVGKMQSTDTYILSLTGGSTPSGGILLSGPRLLTMSDGEQRIVSVSFTSTSVPDSHGVFASWPNGCANWTGTGTNTCVTTPLTCSSCTLTVKIDPLGDNYVSAYEGALGTEFIAPGTRTLVVENNHQYGPPMTRPVTSGVQCFGGASGSNALLVSPDSTSNPTPPSSGYIRPQFTEYDMGSVMSQEGDTDNPAVPYAFYVPSDAGNWPTVDGCIDVARSGWSWFDYTTNILYSAIPNGTGTTILEWQYTAP